MEYKKYLIFDCYHDICTYLDTLDRNLKLSGHIEITETWDKVQEVGHLVNRNSKRYYILTPPEKWRILGPEYLIKDSIDDNPALLEENIFKIYKFLNVDKEREYSHSNYLVEPMSLDYKMHVNIRFTQKNFFDSHGNLVKVEYYENSDVNINALGIKSVTYNNKILEVLFTYFYATDGYLNYRESLRKWIKMDNSFGNELVKRKYYDSADAKKVGERRRRNVQNTLETKVGTALFLNRGSSLVGGNNTFQTVKDADIYGKPLLNTMSHYFDNYVKNDEHSELLTAILNIDTTIYDWVLDNDPFTQKTIQQMIIDTIQESLLN
jgi:hypothetical protein